VRDLSLLKCRLRGCLLRQIATLGITNLVMIAGDAHLLGADDGSHNDYSSGGGGGFPIFQSAPIAQYGSAKVRALQCGCVACTCHTRRRYHRVLRLLCLLALTGNGAVHARLLGLSVLDHAPLLDDGGAGQWQYVPRAFRATLLRRA
jgi:hypothetical protein